MQEAEKRNCLGNKAVSLVIQFDPLTPQERQTIDIYIRTAQGDHP